MGFCSNIKNETVDRIKLAIQEYVYQNFGANIDVCVFYTNNMYTGKDYNLTITISPAGLRSVNFNSFKIVENVPFGLIDNLYEDLFPILCKKLDPMLIKAFSGIIKDRNIQFISAVKESNAGKLKKAKQIFIDQYRTFKNLGVSHTDSVKSASLVYESLAENITEVKTTQW